MDIDLKEQLIASVANIKNKIKMIQCDEDEASLKYMKVFKPITDPLEKMIKNGRQEIPTLNITTKTGSAKTDEDLHCSIDYDNFKEIINKNPSTHSEYYESTNDNQLSYDALLSLKKEDMMDIYEHMNVPFGIHTKNRELMMGNTPVSLSLINNAPNTEKKYIVTVNDKKYELTAGLKELLMRNKPDLKIVSEKDKFYYKEMLIHTNAHKRDFDPNGQLKGDKGLKYNTIIKPLFSQLTTVNKDLDNKLVQPKIGGHLPELKHYKRNTDYIYWDDPNELIERLKLLIASKNAGNNNHDNEIISIIEELKEANIIKE
jgi:hypothetical protein